MTPKRTVPGAAARLAMQQKREAEGSAEPAATPAIRTPTVPVRPLVRLPPRPSTSAVATPPPVAPAAEAPPVVVRPVAPEPETHRSSIALEPGKVDAGLKKVGEEITYWVNKGRYTKVRIKLGNRQLLPDLPIGVAVGAEALSYAVFGPLRAVLGGVLTRVVLDIEFVNDAMHHVNRGRELILAGELEPALAQFRQGLALDRDCAAAHLHIGIALKLKGDREGARASLERAADMDAKGPSGLEAEKLLVMMRTG